ncbi:MFS transporter [Prevotella sp. P5-126]|uniref:MFS transporter n=1 Tax=unclassified Prevotella TaxID=2638335 RepID=UPI000B969433|nr:MULTISPECIES: MFS transporter [unclassified Prevotella]MBS7318465.1 MFS transporter [Prevotella sp.]MCF2559190.1 MFS transporter [Xylanibacter brevis]OYP37584.1 MFS transporter [Prevotella sp. P5-126]OYP44003.1 MFS transporter [Prevotella sp. P4-119]OYP45372.1 MFS transporter [Prevotella sp. P4-98]
MTQEIQKTLRDSAAMRWTALLLLALAMFCSYIFMDILSPIKDLMQEYRGWDSTAFGTMQGSEVFLNVFVFFLIFAGIILDKMGVRFTAVLSAAVMLTGAIVKWYAVTDYFTGSSLEVWFNNNLNYIPVFDELGVSPFYEGMPASAKFAACGFMIFGCGCEMAGITVSRGIVKWFKGREMALAMGSEMALARLGVATCMIFSPFFAKLGGNISVSRSVAFGVVLMCIALIMTIVYFFMDKKLDSQTGEAEEKDDPFKISDLGQILTSSGFWLVALLCVLYYSAIFPFQKYAVNMLQCNLTLVEPSQDSFWASSSVTIVQYVIMLIVAAAGFASNFQKVKRNQFILLAFSIISLITYCYMGYMRQSAESIFAVFPLLAVLITPILGSYVDHKGKAASMLILGSVLLIACHLTFAFILPLFKDSAVGGIIIAYATILVLGSSFSLVPASLWPSVPKLVDAKVIGSAYALIFWIQNIGLWLFPLLIGKVLDKSNPGVTDPTKFDYTAPLIMLASLGVAALLLGFVLKAVDKKKGLGLEEPNIK